MWGRQARKAGSRGGRRASAEARDYRGQGRRGEGWWMQCEGYGLRWMKQRVGGHPSRGPGGRRDVEEQNI
nr:hypothetical protein CFP56_56547 [Quercus suber]